MPQVMLGPGKEEIIAELADWILQHSSPAQKL